MFGVTSKKASDQDWGLDELGTMVSDLVRGQVSSPLTPVSSTCTEASAVCGCWHPLPMLYSSGQGEPEKPRTWGEGYTNRRARTHRHIVKFIVRNSLFHQVWLLCGP